MKEYKDLAGIQLLVASKKLKRIPKGAMHIPRNCVLETIPRGKSQLQEAETFIFDAARDIKEMEDKQHYTRNRFSCRNIYGQCKYNPLCVNKIDDNPEYRQSVIEAQFKIEDPEEHLNPDKKENNES
jgi:hypothetical protein